MYKYKRGINNSDMLGQVEYVLSDGHNACLCMSASLSAIKPYNGLYIKNGKVIVENVIEKIEIRDKVYKMVELNTSTKNLSCLEYITSVDLDDNVINYDIGPLSYLKRIAFSNKYKLLSIEYEIKNKSEERAKFKVIPMITYRDLFTMKQGQMIKFNQRKANNGVMINLSVMNDENISLQSENMTFSDKPVNLNNVKHEYVDLNGNKNIYTEDLLLPGEFEVVIDANSTKNVRIYISPEEKDLSRIAGKYVETEAKAIKKMVTEGIHENFVELIDLASAINNLTLEENIVSSLPYSKDYNKVIQNDDYINENTEEIKKDILVFTDIVRSVDGQYLTFNKVNLASKVLLKVRRYIKNVDSLKIEDDDLIKKLMLLKLWYVEEVNKILQKENDVLLYLDIVKDIVYQAIDKKDILLNEIKYVALIYNAIKIYEEMLKQRQEEDININEISKYIEDLIVERFWSEEKRILRKDLNKKEEIANIDMIYTLSLSYSPLTYDIPFKLLDTIFKELYTPYGLREFPKSQESNTKIIYPKYMAHFVKANLKQNGVTAASQKIAYNMVKELLLDINKYVNGGVKKMYHEKGINIDNLGYDLLTNAELIRLYDMLT